MNKVDIGRVFEEEAKEILLEEGYNIKSHQSSKNWTSPFDFIVEKDKNVFYIEVRGVTYFRKPIITKKKIDSLKKLNNALVLTITKEGYHFIKIDDIEKSDYIYIINSNNICENGRVLNIIESEKNCKNKEMVLYLIENYGEKISKTRLSFLSKLSVKYLERILVYLEKENKINVISKSYSTFFIPSKSNKSIPFNQQYQNILNDSMRFSKNKRGFTEGSGMTQVLQ